MKPEHICCREMMPQDFLAVSRQVAVSYRAAYRGLMREDYLSALPDDHWVPVLQAALAAGNTCLVALCETEIVGSIVFGKSTANRSTGMGEIFALYLLPSYIGLGIGHRLYCEAERRMLEQGAIGCIAEALCENTRSIQFCLDHGFQETGIFCVKENGMTLSCKRLRKDWLDRKDQL